jgi:hypothetical protein
MAQSLGSIYIDLTASTGGFVTALSKAAAEAQKTAKEVGKQFSELGEIASQTFGAFGEEFNPIVSKFSFVLSSAGNAASSAMKEFSKLGGVIGPLAALGTGAAVGLAAASAVLVGIATHAAEAAAEMQHLSESTGVPVERLSALSFAAKAAHLDLETLAKGLERLDKAIAKAAAAPEGTANAFSNMGVKVKNAAGEIRPVNDILLDTADKFQGYEEGAGKVALAAELLGQKLGPRFIPFLNMGRDGIKDFLDYATKVGAVLSGDAARAAEEYERTLTKISIAGMGVQNTIMTALLPALTAVAEGLKKTAEDGNSFGSTLLSAFLGVTKMVVAGVETWMAGFEQMGAVLRHMGADVVSLGTLFADLFNATKTGDFSGIGRAFKDELQRMADNARLFNADSKKIWQDNADFINKVYGQVKLPDEKGGTKKPPPGIGKAAGGAVPTDIVAELIGKLQAQAAAEIALASATDKSTSAMLLAKSAAEARQKIDETRVHLQEREKALLREISDARQEANDKDSEQAGLGGAQHVARVQAELRGVRQMLAELEAKTPLINQLFAQIAAGGFGAKAAEDLQKFIDKTDQETAALKRINEALGKGPGDVAAAKIAETLAPFEKQLSDMQTLIARMQALRIPTGTAGSEPLIGHLFGSLDEGAARLKSQIGIAQGKEAEKVSQQITNDILKTNQQLAAEARGYQLVADAALKSAAAQREAAASAEVEKYRVAHPEATGPQLKDVHDAALGKLDAEHAKTIALTAAQYDLNAAYEKEFKDLQDTKAFLEKKNADTTAIDTQIYQTRIRQITDIQKQVFESQNAQLLGEEKIYDMSVQLTQAWDKAAFSVGTLGQKFHAVLNEIQLQGQNLSGKIFESFTKAIDDVSTQLSKLVVTGKANFKELFQNLEESIVKASFQKLFAVTIGKLVPGLGGKPDGSDTNPLHVVVKNMAGLFGRGGSGAEGDEDSSSSIFGDSIGKIKDVFSNIFSSVGSVLGNIASSIGSVFSSVAGFFGGFLADGGRVSSGTPYIVGEKRPEIFVPDRAGKIVPSVSQFLNSGEARAWMGPDLSGISRREYGGSVMAGVPYLTGERRPEVFVPSRSDSHGAPNHPPIIVNINGVTDFDSFKRSGSQVAAGLHRASAIAFARNG